MCVCPGAIHLFNDPLHTPTLFSQSLPFEISQSLFTEVNTWGNGAAIALQYLTVQVRLIEDIFNQSSAGGAGGTELVPGGGCGGALVIQSCSNVLISDANFRSLFANQGGAICAFQSSIEFVTPTVEDVHASEVNSHTHSDAQLACGTV